MKRTLPFMFYLVYFAAAVFIQPFAVVYFQELGFNGVQIGILVGIIPLGILIGAPLWTGLADAKMRHKLIMSLTIVVNILVAAIFPLARSFALLIPLVFIYAFFAAPIISFADSATLSMLAEKKDLYGRVRLGGTFGWGVFALVSGLIIDRYGIRWAFWGYSAIMVFTLIIGLQFTFGQPPERASVRIDVRKILSDRRWGWLLSLAFLGGVALTVINTMLAPYMVDLGATKTTVGLALFIATLSELPVLFFANRLLERFSARGLFALGMLISGLRLILSAAFNSQTGILIIQLLNGLTFPIVWVAGISYANEIAPAGMKATAQGLLAAMVSGIGAAAGGAVGGLLLGSVHGQATFLIIGIFVLIAVGVITLLDRVESIRQARKLV